MSKPLVTFPDVEHLVVDWLTDLVANTSILDDIAQQLADDFDVVVLSDLGLSVSVGVPDDYVATDGAPHLEVACDGTPRADWPIVTRNTVRIIARAGSTTMAKAVAGAAQSALLAGGWPTGISSIRFLTGILAARDPATRFELASFTVQVNVRSTLA